MGIRTGKTFVRNSLTMAHSSSELKKTAAAPLRRIRPILPRWISACVRIRIKNASQMSLFLSRTYDDDRKKGTDRCSPPCALGPSAAASVLHLNTTRAMHARVSVFSRSQLPYVITQIVLFFPQIYFIRGSAGRKSPSARANADLIRIIGCWSAGALHIILYASFFEGSSPLYLVVYHIWNYAWTSGISRTNVTISSCSLLLCTSCFSYFSTYFVRIVQIKYAQIVA